MSLCIILMSEDQLVIGGDSRACRMINEVEYATNDDVRKLHFVGDKFIFCGGLAITGQKIVEELKQIQDPSIDTILEISKQVTTEFKANDPNYNPRESAITNVTIACFENGRPAVYNFGDFDNFEVKKIEPKNHIRIITVGSHQQIAEKMASKLCNYMDVIPMYEQIYSLLASEQMGGTLTMYIVDPNLKSPYRHTSKIIDRRPIRRLNVNNISDHCVMSNSGLQVFDGSAVERLKVGSVGTERGFKATHTDGSYTQMTESGFKRFVSGTGYDYHYRTHVGSGSTTGGGWDIATNTATVTLPSDFQGKDFKVNVSFQSADNIATLYIKGITCRIVDGSINQTNGTFIVDAFIKFSPPSGDMSHLYGTMPCSFTYIVQY